MEMEQPLDLAMVSEALDAALGEGIVQLDKRPANLLVTKKWPAKITS